MINLYEANRRLKNYKANGANHFVIWSDDMATPCRTRDDVNYLLNHNWTAKNIGKIIYVINVKPKEKNQ